MIEKKQDDVFNNNKNVSLSACLSLLLPLLHHSKKQTLPVSVFYYLMQLRRGIMNADVKMPSVIFYWHTCLCGSATGYHQPKLTMTSLMSGSLNQSMGTFQVSLVLKPMASLRRLVASLEAALRSVMRCRMSASRAESS